MEQVVETPGQLFRTDPLIGCGNLLGFSELLSTSLACSDHPPFSLLTLDINGFSEINSTKGQVHGDAVLRWIGIRLMEESRAPVYRLGGDEFVAVLLEGNHSDHARLGKHIFTLLNHEAKQFGLKSPAAAITVIHYDASERVVPSRLFARVTATIYDVKKNFQGTFHTYQAQSIEPGADPQFLPWIVGLMFDRIVSLGGMLNETQHLAYTDPVTGLPNLREAQRQLATMVANALSTGQTFSILFIDGDDLRRYNKISYAAGDEMIYRLGATIGERLRPGDFLARWRVGDEFLVILSGATAEQAVLVGNRLCAAVQQASQEWPLPVTISIGVASFPMHGDTENSLLRQAEKANDAAKAKGKNQVVAFLETGGNAGGEADGNR